MAIHTEAHDGYGVLSLDRIDKANAYDRAHLDALEAGFIALSTAAHVVVIRALGGGAFCGGADLDEMRDATPDDDPAQAAMTLATELALRSPEAMRMAKEIIDHRGEDASLEAERLAQAELYALRRH